LAPLMGDRIVNQKLDQAEALLREQRIDAWLLFVRETSLTPDPCIDLVVGLDLVWHSAFLISRTGARVAIVGRFDAEGVRAIGGYTEVIPYDQSIRPPLREAVARLDPQTIAVNYSSSDPSADGLTHGLWLTLQETLADTPYARRLVSAETLVTALRGRKSAAEADRIRAAIRVTERLFAHVGKRLRAGQTEEQIAGAMKTDLARLGLRTAWSEPYCPIVNAGPNSPVGHAAPGRFKTARGQLLHIDFGVKNDGFCSDLQRMWYFRRRGERRAPDEVRRAWDACWAAMDAGAERLRAGVQGGRWTRPRAPPWSRPAIPSTSMPSAMGWAAQRTTARRSSGPAGTATGNLPSGSWRRATSSRWSWASPYPDAATWGWRKTCS